MMMFSFSISHSFVIEDAHHHHSYEKEWSDQHVVSSYNDTQEVHDIYCEFHHSYILTQNFTFAPDLKISSLPSTKPDLYTYHKIGNFLKPPIT